MTRVRLLQWNMRRSTSPVDALIPSRRWDNRKKYALQFVERVAPSVITAQECTLQQVTDVTRALGPNWSYWGEPSNRQVLWDGLKWDVLTAHTFTWKSVKRTQTAAFVRLQRRSSGDPLWVASFHLEVGDSNGAVRNAEMVKLLDHLHTLPGYQKSVLAGDLNSSSESSGPRKVAREAGWKSLRAKTIDEDLSGEAYSTWNGWKKTETNSRWIDDVLTPAGVKPYAGSVELACLRRYPICASDHNGLRVSFEY